MKIVVSKNAEKFPVPDGWHTAWCLAVWCGELFNKFEQKLENSVIFALGVNDAGRKKVFLVRKRFSTNEKSGMMSVIRAIGITADEFELEECIGRPCNILLKDGKVVQITPALNEKPITVTTTLGQEAIERFVAWAQKQEAGGSNE